jgi:uncharacterized membrane protein YphA (DoxX/SURF4 family)
MFQSARHSQLILRLGLAITFFALGMSKFFQSELWIITWVPLWLIHVAARIHVSGTDIANLLGLIEVLTALSLATGFFWRIFAGLGAVILIGSILLHGMAVPLMYHAAVLGGLLALLIWPERAYR